MTFKNIFSLLFVSFSFQILIAQTQPASQPTDLIFLGVKAYGMSLSFTLSGADKYLILRSKSPASALPVDGTEYVIGDRIGNAKVLAIGSNSFYTFREAIANTEYHFTIFAFNQTGSNTNFLSTNPLTGSMTTSGTNIENYYSNYRIDTDDAVDDLTDLLRNHSTLLYGDYRDVVENVLQKDTSIMVGSVSENRKYIIGEYSNIIHVYEDDILFSDYNREHVMARSWMSSSPSSDNDLQAETSDYHNLFLVKASVNQSLRSNYTFDKVDNSGNIEEDCKNGQNQNNDLAFEPKEEVKGNIARTLFYSAITYNGKGGSWAFNNLLSLGNNQDVDLLIQWHLQDPVDNFEIARNEYIYSKQNNRNAFVDFPEWVSCIDFKTLTLNGSCPLDTAQNVPDAIQNLFNAKNVSIYPNPVKDKAFVKISETEIIQKIELFNVNGSLHQLDFDINNNIADIDFRDTSNGFYFLKIYTNESIYTKKINILKQ
ncbi:MAG: endonuclease [Chitinophagales bacterium]